MLIFWIRTNFLKIRWEKMKMNEIYANNFQINLCIHLINPVDKMSRTKGEQAVNHQFDLCLLSSDFHQIWMLIVFVNAIFKDANAFWKKWKKKDWWMDDGQMQMWWVANFRLKMCWPPLCKIIVICWFFSLFLKFERFFRTPQIVGLYFAYAPWF